MLPQTVPMASFWLLWVRVGGTLVSAFCDVEGSAHTPGKLEVVGTVTK